MRAIGDFFFKKNIYTNSWEGVHKDYKDELMNGGTHKISSSSILTLEDLINRTNGDIEKIRELVRLSEIKANLNEVEEEYEV